MTQHSTAGVGLQEFLNGHPWCYLVLDFGLVQRVLAVQHDDSFEKVEDELRALIDGSMSGLKLFGAAWRRLATCKVDAEASKMRDAIFKLSHISSKKLLELKRDAMGKIDSIASVELVQPRRQVDVKFREMKLELSVRSAGELLDMTAQAAVKCLAVDCGALPALPVESSMGKACEDMKQKVTFDEDVLWPAKQARRYFGDVVSLEEMTNGETILVSVHDMPPSKKKGRFRTGVEALPFSRLAVPYKNPQGGRQKKKKNPETHLRLAHPKKKSFKI